MRIAIVLASILSLTGCGDDVRQLMFEKEQLEIQNRELEEEMGRIKVSADGISEQLGELELELSRFDLENWREVVPDVKQDVEWSKAAADQLSGYMAKRSR